MRPTASVNLKNVQAEVKYIGGDAINGTRLYVRTNSHSGGNNYELFVAGNTGTWSAHIQIWKTVKGARTLIQDGGDIGVDPAGDYILHLVLQSKEDEISWTVVSGNETKNDSVIDNSIFTAGNVQWNFYSSNGRGYGNGDYVNNLLATDLDLLPEPVIKILWGTEL